MLHILWMILKFILILLAVILGLVVLMLLLVLFCPVRYRLHAEKTEEQAILETSGEAKISWLFGGISATVFYHEKKPDLSIRLFGIPLDRLLNRKKKTDSEPEDGGANEIAQEENIPEITEKTEETEETAAISEITDDIPNDQKLTGEALATEGSENTPETEESVDTSDTQAAKPVPVSDVQVEQHDEEAPEKPSVFQKIGKILSGIADKIRAVRDKIRNVCTKISWWKEFIFHERTQAAIHLMLEKTGRIIRHFLPTRMSGHMSFGFEDPSITGKIVAFLAMTIPFHKNRIVAQPSFECRSFAEGDITIKGRIYFIVLGMCAVRLLLSKDIRFVLKKWKRRDKEEQYGT